MQAPTHYAERTTCESLCGREELFDTTDKVQDVTCMDCLKVLAVTDGNPVARTMLNETRNLFEELPMR